GSHTNLLWLADWAHNENGSLERFWLFPMIFFRTDPGGYRIFAPFYFRPSGWTDENGYSFSPLHYNSWSKDSDTTFIFPVRYHRIDRPEKYEISFWTPLYYNVETENRDTTLFLPLYFNTANKKTGDSFHFDILGFTRSVTAGPNPNLSFGVGLSDYGWYTDIEVSWMYDMVSAAWRKTIIKTADKPEDNPLEKGKVVMTDRKTVSRDNSVDYFGWKLLFGLVAYEHADTKKHFRLLPLTWLTWDDESDARIRWILNYISYKDETSEYFAFFPLYGSQHIGNSYRYGYLLNLYWSEYDDDKKLYDRTILWPLINWYSSPTEGGSRIIPLYWHRRTTENSVTTTKTLTPLFFARREYNDATNETLHSLTITPVMFANFRKTSTTESGRAMGILPLPFSYTSHAENILSGMDNHGSYMPGENGKPRTTGSTLVILPLYYGSEETTGSGMQSVRETTRVAPLFFSHKTTTTGADGKQIDDGSYFCLGYFGSYGKNRNHASILFGLYDSTTHPETGDYSTSFLYWLHTHEQMDGTYTNYTRPFYYYK
ncbi:MAG TPA: hypothetical protein VF857_08940, partial [Spirochaetota bacterium]